MLKDCLGGVAGSLKCKVAWHHCVLADPSATAPGERGDRGQAWLSDTSHVAEVLLLFPRRFVAYPQLLGTQPEPALALRLCRLRRPSR